MDTSDFARRLADKLIAQLKDGTSPWQKPWKDGQAFGPYNPTTGNRYRGINIVALMAMDFSDPRWMTYKQAQSQGWQVKRREKSAKIQHWMGRGKGATRSKWPTRTGRPGRTNQGAGAPVHCNVRKPILGQNTQGPSATRTDKTLN